MTILFPTLIGSGSSGPGGGNPSITVGSSIAAGRLVLVCIVKDNAASVDGTTSEITSITSSVAGNTWQSAGRYCNSEGATGEGIYVDLWYSVLTNALGAGATITVNKSTDVACCIEAYWFFITGTGMSNGGTPITLQNDNTAPFGTMSVSTSSVTEHLFVRVIGVNVTGGLFTPTDGWSRIDTVLSDPESFDAVKLCGEYIIADADTATSAPSSVSNGDSASILFGLREGSAYARTAAFAATGAMSSTATRTRNRTVQCAAVGTMSSTRTKAVYRSAALSGVGSMSSIARLNNTILVSAAMSGVGAVTSSWILAKLGSMNVVASGMVSSSAVRTVGAPTRHTRSLIMLEGTLRPISNLATWTERIELYDSETGDPIDLEEDVESITLSLRDPYTSQVALVEDLKGENIYVVNPGIIEWSISPEIMGGLDPKSYEVGCLVEMAKETVQVLLGHVSVRRGL